MAVKLIDVSEWQGSIDYEKVKASGIKGVIIRAGYGKYDYQKDKFFEQNYTKAKAAGLDCGVYWYSYADSTASAIEEANVCMKALKGKKFEYPIYFDLEEQSQFSRGRAFCDSIVKAFCGELEKNGYFAGLYISRSPLQTYISSDVANRYALWIAEYGSRCNYNGSYGMWQYSSTGRVNGISGNVDMDECYVDYPKLIKEGGFNGYIKPVQLKTLDTNGLKYDDKNGLAVLALKQLLYIAKKKGWITANFKNDYGFGDGTQAAVNELLKRFGYKQNGVAGENFIKKLGEGLK